MTATATELARASWREREAETQARSREANEATAGARASARAYATHFAIARDHENPEIEQVIEEHERFAVVETVSGEEVKLARISHPRHWRQRRSST